MVSPFLTDCPSKTYHFSILPAMVEFMLCGLSAGFKDVKLPFISKFWVQGKKSIIKVIAKNQSKKILIFLIFFGVVTNENEKFLVLYFMSIGFYDND
jgi:hypothetical protein